MKRKGKFEYELEHDNIRVFYDNNHIISLFIGRWRGCYGAYLTLFGKEIFNILI